MMELIKVDIAKVISKYMKIDAQNMEIQINTVGTKGTKGMKNPTLYANIPILDLHKQQQSLH
jgi:cell division topological specificity factor